MFQSGVSLCCIFQLLTFQLQFQVEESALQLSIQVTEFVPNSCKDCHVRGLLHSLRQVPTGPAALRFMALIFWHGTRAQ